MWVKFLKASKRQAQRAAKLAGYRIVNSGQTTEGSYVYSLAISSNNPNFTTLQALMADAGAFKTSWARQSDAT
jgi:hypothetical protein